MLNHTDARLSKTEDMYENGVSYHLTYSDEAPSALIHDFISVYEEVFGKTYDQNLFDRKYQQNIYGPSILVVAYLQSRPVGARALWRNDINQNVAYQPCDTCVVKEARKLSIFSTMTTLSLQAVKKQAIIYNFPNHQSHQPYLKLGWRLERTYYPCIMFSFNRFKTMHPITIDAQYLEWWLKPNCPDTLFVKKVKHEYLLLKQWLNGKYFALGLINQQAARLLTQVRTPLILFWDEHKSFYNKKHYPLNVMVHTTNGQYIPTYKIDAI